MNRKIKIAAGAVIVLALAYAGTSWWIGYRAQAIYETQLATAKTLLGPGVLVEGAYRHGIFSSANELVLQLPAHLAGGGNDSALRVHLANEIQHGPIAANRFAAAAIDTRITRVEGLDDATRAAWAGVKAPTINTVIGLLGDVSGKLSLPAGNVGQDAASRSLQWAPAQLDFTVNERGTDVRAELIAPQFAARATTDGRPVSLRLDALRGQFNATPGGGAWLLTPGSSVVSAERLTLGDDAQPAAEPALALTDLHWRSATTAAGETLGNEHHFTGKGRIGNTVIEAIEYQGRIEQIDRQAVIELQRLLVDARRAADGDAALPGLRDMEALARRLMATQPEISGRASATVDGRDGALEFRLALPDEPPRGLGALIELPWPARLAQRFNASATVHLPADWVPRISAAFEQPLVTPQRLGAGLDELVSRGWLRLEDGTYVGTLEFARGRLRINDERPSLWGVPPNLPRLPRR